MTVQIYYTCASCLNKYFKLIDTVHPLLRNIDNSFRVIIIKKKNISISVLNTYIKS